MVDWACCREILRLGFPFACRILLPEGVLPAAAFLLAPFGAPAVAAHAVASRVVDLCGVFTFGFGDAANARGGYAVTAGKPGHAACSAWVAVRLSAGGGLMAAIGMVVAPSALAQIVLGGASEADIAAVAALLPLAAALLLLESVQSAVGGALRLTLAMAIFMLLEKCL